MPRQAAPLRAAKEALRAQIVAARLALPPHEHAVRSQAIAEDLTALASWQRARAVLLTLPVRGEWDASLVARAALATGKMVVLPRVDAPARMLALHRVDDLVRDIAAGRHGIPEQLLTDIQAGWRLEDPWIVRPAV